MLSMLQNNPSRAHEPKSDEQSGQSQVPRELYRKVDLVAQQLQRAPRANGNDTPPFFFPPENISPTNLKRLLQAMLPNIYLMMHGIVVELPSGKIILARDQDMNFWRDRSRRIRAIPLYLLELVNANCSTNTARYNIMNTPASALELSYIARNEILKCTPEHSGVMHLVNDVIASMPTLTGIDEETLRQQLVRYARPIETLSAAIVDLREGKMSVRTFGLIVGETISWLTAGASREEGLREVIAYIRVLRDDVT